MSCCIGSPTTISTSGIVSVTSAETTLLANNFNRKNAVIQNHGAAVLQVYFTTGQAFGAGPILLQQYQTWSASQAGAGVYQGIIYGRTSAATQNAGRIEET